jgi:hypothetical protein
MADMSKKNHTKSELFLMEFIAVILFFSICTAICISAFVKADNISKESDLLNGAMILAQSVAEEIKATEDITGQKYQNYKDDSYYLDVSTEIKDKILVADITVFDAKIQKKEICRLEVKKYLPDEV